MEKNKKEAHPISEDVTAKIAMQISGAFLHLDEHISKVMEKHLDQLVMLGLGFERESYGTLRIRSVGTGSAIVDAVSKITHELVKDQARSIFAKAIKGKKRAALADVIRKHFIHSYREALLQEIRLLVSAEIRNVEIEIQNELSTEIPRNFALVIEPLVEGVRQNVLEQLANGYFTTQYNETCSATVEQQLDLERKIR